MILIRFFAMAIIDAAFNKKEKNVTTWNNVYFSWKRTEETEQKENALFQETKVNFNSMDSGITQ
jgi:hypothetical protein